MTIQSYRDLLVWQKAMDLVAECYRLSESFPKTEIYGLASQLRRAAVSIPANIAEGHGREHLGDYLHHLSIANGSLMEVETHLLLAEKLSFLTSPQTDPALSATAEASRMLSGLIRSLKNIRNKTNT
ncbi:MAG: four helix bundle protein [Blastocatellia bacterium]|nr:four helix bundle protein [Blastocatellia bacterium]